MRWDYYKQFYLSYSKTYQFKNKVNKAISIINSFPSVSGLDLKNIYCTCSAGKDSTVLSILVNKVYPNIKIFSQKDNYDYPGEIEYLRMLQNRYKLNIDIIEVEIDISNINIFEQIHKRGTEISDKYFYSIIDKYKKDNNYKGVFLGLRKEESKIRKINLCKRGYIYKKSNNDWVCNPLSDFLGRDIFAFLLSNNIEPFEIYKKCDFCHPEKIRKSWYLPGSFSNKGSVTNLKYYYPELFKKLEDKNKNIRKYL